ncbi:MAG: type II toxin-antitoxin system VapB family antitoxin [Gammaproteobacteria bacterium SHHR-1]|jgi:Arc/MetJ family transcription regulator|uniref:type II toxin-antitoxin system VapB family antitoxin n=1 Tax=Magnetovirga frankeli TaxID=947516 RepID=UPI001292EEC1|nr:type II toxin-antitoxin system VapB family antitoxin [gamma proteobacterium SS-5]
MRTNIVLDDELMAEAMRICGARSKREVVDLALREMVAHHSQRQLLKLKGSDLIDPDYDLLKVRRWMDEDAG